MRYLSSFCFLLSLLLLYSCGGTEQPRKIDYSIDDEKHSSNNQLSSVALVEEIKSPQNVLNMEIEDGVRYVWIEVNDVRLRFILDTGASNICISLTEAHLFLKQGLLSEEDIIGNMTFQDATGRISKGTKILLRKVKIGNMILEDVEALVINNNEAPLLLGQTVLEQFGKIEIDNENNTIILK